jgi:hypothetical protein
MGRCRGTYLPGALLSLVYIAGAILAPTGCSDRVEDPGCDLFLGSAIVKGVAHDFDGFPVAKSHVEFAISDTAQCGPEFQWTAGHGETDEDGHFEVLLHSGNTDGVRCVFGRVAGSDSISIGRVKFTSDCRRSEPIEHVELNLFATPSAMIPADLAIRLYRLHAHGAGPHYSVSVQADGYVQYEGLDSVIVEGFADTTIDLISVARLYRAFEPFGYWDIKTLYREDECDFYIFDIHYASTSLRANGKEHCVVHDHGCCGIPELEQLTYLECKIDTVLGTSRWTGSWAKPCGWPPGQICPPSQR